MLEERPCRYQTLKKSEAFARVLRQGQWIRGTWFHLYYLPEPADGIYAGFAASRKLYTRVRKNRAKRRLREVFRRYCGWLPPGSFVLMGTEKTLQAPFSDLIQEFHRLCQKLPHGVSSSA